MFPPVSVHYPAKAITQADFLSGELVFFGSQEYIEAAAPEPMGNGQYAAWPRYRAEHWNTLKAEAMSLPVRATIT